MTFKVYFQPDNTKRPVRENTQSIYIEADSEAEALLMVEHHTDYNIEYVEQLDEKALEYEKQIPILRSPHFNSGCGACGKTPFVTSPSFCSAVL